jgi:signal transduction histidine kinase
VAVVREAVDGMNAAAVDGTLGGTGGAGDETNGVVRPSRVGQLLMLVLWLAVVVRLFTLPMEPGQAVWYVAGLAGFLAIHLVVLRWRLSTAVVCIAFALQAAITLLLLALNPERDFMTILLIVECYQSAVLFAGRTRLAWVAALVALIGVSLMMELGPLHGLALALIPMAAGIVLSTYDIVSRELEASRARSQRMVGDLRVAQEQLKVYAGQVEELAAIDERARVARELEESVSTTLSDVLSVTAAAQRALDEPRRATAELERLRTLTQQALAQMRSVITELRPGAATGAAESATGTEPTAT